MKHAGEVCRSSPTASCSKGGHFLDAHPELAMRGPDGKPLQRYCYNSGYLPIMERLTSEMLAYGIDGFHIDMLDQGFGPPYGCWCDACRHQFEAVYHRPMPKGVTWDADWDRMLEFRYKSSQQFELPCATTSTRSPPAPPSTSIIMATRRSRGRPASARCSMPATVISSPVRRVSGASVPWVSA